MGDTEISPILLHGKILKKNENFEKKMKILKKNENFERKNNI